MFFDLNVQIPQPATAQRQQQLQGGQNKKGKGKQASEAVRPVTYTAGQLLKIESRVDLLVQWYTVIAFNQTIQTKTDPKSHVNTLVPLLKQLKTRSGILYLKRLTFILDEDSEKGFGLTTANGNLFASYDILALQPTTAGSFQQACLTHTLPSPLTCHIISLPLTLPRLPFRLKHTVVRTAVKNGALFEVNYSGALEGESERRNWWAGAREVMRVTKGKAILVSSGSDSDANLRAPRDISNLLVLCGIGQNLAHDANTSAAKSLILRAQTRKTYRAVLSEPTLVQPLNIANSTPEHEHETNSGMTTELQERSVQEPTQVQTTPPVVTVPSSLPANTSDPSGSVPGKRSLVEEDDGSSEISQTSTPNKKRRKQKDKRKGVGS